MAALLFFQRTLEGRSGPAAGGIEEQPSHDRVMGNVLWTGLSGEPGALRESTRGGPLDRIGLNSGSYDGVDLLDGGDSAKIGSMEDHNFPNDTRAGLFSE